MRLNRRVVGAGERLAQTDQGSRTRRSAPHDLRHHAITKLAESPEASEQTIMAIAGHVSREMLEHYSYVRQEAK
jgi:hypothetical protein